MSIYLCTLGMIYCGMVQYGIYNKLYPVIFGRMKEGFNKNISRTMVDMVFHSTFFYFPIFYIFKGFVYERSISIDIIKQQLHQYFMINFKEDMIDLYKIWLPTIFLMFYVIPMQYRVPWISTIGIVWAILLSLKRGDADEKTTIIEQNENNLLQSASTSSLIKDQLNGLTIPTIGETQQVQEVQF